MITFSTKVDNLDAIDRVLNKVSIISNIQDNRDYFDFIKKKVEATLKEVINERLSAFDDNDNLYAESVYRASNHFKDTENGFILYNDAKVPVDTDGYDGSFNIALAYEYGTGIVGEGNPVEGHWQYNVKGHNTYWSYLDRYGEVQFTLGSFGMEIYRFTRASVEQRLPEWNKEYLERSVDNG